MTKETRTAIYDDILGIEAFRFEGGARAFPSHFHEYYVIGLVVNGERRLTCNGKDYPLHNGSMVIFNPGDNHACIQHGNGTFEYLCLNIAQNIMLNLAEEITGISEKPYFCENVIYDVEAACRLKQLHILISDGSNEFKKAETLLLLISLLMRKYTNSRSENAARTDEIDRVCAFLEQHYAEQISLEHICRCANMSKSALLRAFTKSKGVTPYNYLQNIRISKAKKLLEKGIPPAEAALQTGYYDQSHFTNYFSRFIGLSPGAYREIFSGKNDAEDKIHEK